MHKSLKSRLIWAGIGVAVFLLVIVLLNMLLVTDANKEKYKAYLDEKREEVNLLTAAAAGASIVIAAIPEDATTPIAEQIASVASYLVVVSVVIQAEKLIVVFGWDLAVKILIPSSLVLFLLFVALDKKRILSFCSRLIAVAVCLLIMIPLCQWIDDKINEHFHTEQILSEAVAVEEPEETTEAKKSWLENAGAFFSGIKDSLAGIPESVKSTLIRYLDGVVMMILTSCVVPVAVFFVLVMVLKGLFGAFISPEFVRMERLPERAAGQETGSRQEP